MQYANKTQFSFDPVPESFAATAVADAVYATPSAFSEALGDLARLSFTRGVFKAKVKLSESDSATFTVNLKAGSKVVASRSLSIAAGTVGYLRLSDLDLTQLSAGVSGATPLAVSVDVTAAGAVVGLTAFCAATLDIEHPVVIA